MLKKMILIGALALGVTSAQASTITVQFDSADLNGSSLAGSIGYLTITDVSPGVYDVTWSLDTTGFNDAGATASNHEYLTSLAFKAFTSVSAVTISPLDAGLGGTLFWPSNVNNVSGNCASTSEAGFICFDVNPDALATTNQVISKTFRVTGTIDESLAWSFRGKYGPGNGWVISVENTAPPVPEPASAAVFGLGAAIVGAALRRRRR